MPSEPAGSIGALSPEYLAALASPATSSIPLRATEGGPAVYGEHPTPHVPEPVHEGIDVLGYLDRNLWRPAKNAVGDVFAAGGDLGENAMRFLGDPMHFRWYSSPRAVEAYDHAKAPVAAVNNAAHAVSLAPYRAWDAAVAGPLGLELQAPTQERGSNLQKEDFRQRLYTDSGRPELRGLEDLWGAAGDVALGAAGKALQAPRAIQALLTAEAAGRPTTYAGTHNRHHLQDLPDDSNFSSAREGALFGDLGMSLAGAPWLGPYTSALFLGNGLAGAANTFADRRSYDSLVGDLEGRTHNSTIREDMDGSKLVPAYARLAGTLSDRMDSLRREYADELASGAMTEGDLAGMVSFTPDEARIFRTVEGDPSFRQLMDRLYPDGIPFEQLADPNFTLPYSPIALGYQAQDELRSRINQDMRDIAGLLYGPASELGHKAVSPLVRAAKALSK